MHAVRGEPLLPRVALVTSGLGTRYGGIGVVAQLMTSALQGRAEVIIWQHPPFWPRLIRIAAIVWRAFWGSRRHFDLVIYDHVHLAVLHHLIPGLRRVPYVIFLHSVEVWRPQTARRKDALLKAAMLLSNSTTTVTQAKNFNPWLPDAQVVWLGVPNQTRPADVASSKPIALMVGRILKIERYKGHDAVLDAWPQIRQAVPGAALLIVGTGDDEQRLRDRVANERIDGITFYGRLSDADRDAIYRTVRLLIFASKGEGFGLASAEAASFGVPILGLAGTVTEELFPAGTGAVFAGQLDGPSIAEATIPLMADPMLAADLGKAARARVQSVFREEHFLERFRQAIFPLLTGAF